MDRLFEDDFQEDWAAPGRAARWRLRPLPWLARGDGRVGTPGDGCGLCVESGYGGVGAGERPAFTRAPEGREGEAHLRWAAFAERPGAAHGSFAYAVPVAPRTPEAWHRCAVEVEPSAGRARWLLDGEEVFAVDRTGLELDAGRHGRHLERSTPGPRTEVAPDRLAFGLGLLATTAYGQGVRLRARRAALSAGAGTTTAAALTSRRGTGR
ncbi:hypothetical protein GPZ77_17105 [Streptomyces sp. QHH-9511]|uniref:DUF6081 family protein n=1 Tax=Streptomyces sp. QHH-9511 TaxID=2684468 RepID=UPI0013177D78|nr:DUF6081 family protein [Streptomyces sp. QHH-9511]QGZ49858.1 hypothetical protein GPZ77_17105 [Streptomyces sp. QHH-9511]